jgi:hypothetical protein
MASLGKKITGTVQGGMDGSYAKGGNVNPLSDIVKVPPPLPSPPPSPPPPYPPPPSPPPRPPFAPLGPAILNTVFEGLNGGYNDGGNANPMRDLVEFPPPGPPPDMEVQSVRGFAEASVSGTAENLGSVAGTAFLIVAVMGVVMAMVSMVRRGARKGRSYFEQSIQDQKEQVPLVAKKEGDATMDFEQGEEGRFQRQGSYDTYGSVHLDCEKL